MFLIKEQQMSVYKKLMQARIKLHGMEIKKSGYNTFAKYNYMELADFLIPAQQTFNELGLCGVVSFTADVATLTITDMETDKQILITSPMGSAALKGCHEVQNVGAVETYQRRYLWVAALEIVEHDALDSTTGMADTKSKGPDLAAILKGISGAINVEILKSNYEAALQMLDETHYAAINKATSLRKRELTQHKDES